MATQRPRFYNGGLYHVYNRGVEKRKIFMDDKDYFRFIHNLFGFNDSHSIANFGFHYRGRTPIVERRPRKLLIDIVAYVLMPNHYHLLLRQRQDGGVSLFLKKIGVGYTGYFNTRHIRSGALFQGKYKVKPVGEDTYLKHLVNYIHANPTAHDSSEIDLRKYRWSSYRDYLGDQNFPSLLNFRVIEDVGLQQGAGLERSLAQWIRNREEHENLLKSLGALLE